MIGLTAGTAFIDRPRCTAEVVYVTTTWYNEDLRYRAYVCLDMIKAVIALGRKIVIVDGGTKLIVDVEVDGRNLMLPFPEAAKRLGAIVVAEQKGPDHTMGAGRRQALAEAHRLFPEAILVWTEEKPLLVTLIEQALQLVADGGAQIVVPNRGESGMTSLPKIQRLLEEAGNEYWDRFFGFQADKPLFDLADGTLDLWVGVRIISPEAVGHFLEYDGRHGDRWMSIFAPVVLAAADGLVVTSYDLDDKYSYEQRQWELMSQKKASKSLDQALELWEGAETLAEELAQVTA